ncbi:hypothetical protein [Chryseobacterium sp. VD8]|uniref:hypothetical protein n=1 Tax=Chryseobacterium sp. VD8 TaxID=3081254 RepID=UPI00301AF95C
MNLLNSKISNPDIYVYVEEFNKKKKTVLIDFFDSNYYQVFTNEMGIEYNLDSPTMVMLNGYRYNIKEDTIYKINLDVIDFLRNNINLISQNENSFLIGFTINVENIETKIFGSSISVKKLDGYFNRYIDLSKFTFDIKGKLKVIIRNVGHGNWNEILSNDEVKIVFDAGASLNESKSNIRKIIDNRNIEYNNAKPILILSHWDKDHYHALLGMTDSELRNNFSAFICRSNKPNLTSRKLFSRIENALGIAKTYPISANVKNSKRGVVLFKNINPITDQIVLYNAEEHKDRNISGLVLSVKSKNNSVILSGDCHYGQISRDILPHLNFKHQHHLVVPHHGGNAGKYIYEIPKNAIPGRAIISSGKNSYGHPLTKNIDSLKSNRYIVEQTIRTNNDIIIQL